MLDVVGVVGGVIVEAQKLDCDHSQAAGRGDHRLALQPFVLRDSCAALVAITAACLIIQTAGHFHLISMTTLLSFSNGAARRNVAGLSQLDEAAQQVAGVYADRHVPHLARTVVLLSANMAYTDFLFNWVCCVRRLHERIKFMVLTQDRQLYKHLRRTTSLISVDGTLLGINSTSSFSNLDTPNFIRITFMKLKAVQSLLELGYDVLFTDADICWLEDPFQYIQPDIAFQFSTDFVWKRNTKVVDHHAQYGSFIANTGFYFMKAVPQTAAFLEHVQLNCCSAGNDQLVLNIALKHWLDSKLAVQIPLNSGNASTYITMQGLQRSNALSVQYLDPVSFPSGFDFFYEGKMQLTRLMRESNKSVAAVHVTWTVGHDAKVALLRTAKLWHVTDNLTGKIDCDT
eukprot:jgi/Chlat1/609/Chrsp103S01035